MLTFCIYMIALAVGMMVTMPIVYILMYLVYRSDGGRMGFVKWAKHW